METHEHKPALAGDAARTDVSLAQKTGRRVAALRYEDLPPEVIVSA